MISRTPEWYQDAQTGAIPALDFLFDVPEKVRVNLLAIRDAVRFSGGPERWQDTNTHALMRGDLSFMYEVRDRQDQTLYRLYLIWDRATADIVMVDGKSKPNDTAISQRQYDTLAELGQRILATDPRPYATVDDVIKWSLARGTG